MSKPIDHIYSSPLDSISGFRFDSNVAQVFPDMIQRSVPGYATIIHMIGQLAERYAQSGSNLYDLGCSLGAATLAMRHRAVGDNLQIIAVDNSSAMLERCKTIIDADPHPTPVRLIENDIQNLSIENASICILNFTLQFIPVDDRLRVLKEIRQGMKPGGVLILSEKIAFEDEHNQELMTELHHNFKRANGYSDLEIAQKRSALENVLIPETVKIHNKRLSEAGFISIECWFQCFNFVSMIAFNPKK